MRTTIHRPVFFALAASLLTGLGSAQSELPDIVGVATKSGQFETLTAALAAAGLVDALRGEGPLTVLAPTDEAFAKLPSGTVEKLLEPGNREQLSRILQFHVVPGAVDASAALSAGSAATLIGETVRFRLERGALTVNGARVLDNDIAAKNGLIHVVDTVLIPPAAPQQDPNQRAMDLIRLAVERGIPLFNGGDIQACVDVYELTTRSLIDFGADQLSEPVIEPLVRALARSVEREDTKFRAWALRGGLDQAYFALRKESALSTASVNDFDEAKAVFGFDGTDNSRWFTLNDDVMGGVSRSSFQLTSEGTALFTGALSLANNGGFATIRSSAADLGLAGYDTLVVRVKGDGRSYGLHAMPTSGRGGVSYWAAKFDTADGEWTEVAIPIASMKRSVMGRRVPFSGPLAPEKIRSLSFMIADKNEAPFSLEIDWIKAVRSGADQTAED